jgi:hypothetical protein
MRNGYDIVHLTGVAYVADDGESVIRCTMATRRRAAGATAPIAIATAKPRWQ